MIAIPDRYRMWAVRAGLAFLLLAPPVLGGGEGSVALLAIHTTIFLLIAIGPRLAPAAAAGRFRPALLGFAAACGWAVVSFLRSTYRFGSFVSLFDLILFFLLFLFVAGGRWSDRDRRGAQLCCLIAATIAALWALVQFGLDPATRPTAGFVNTNHLAACLALGFWAAAGRAAGSTARPERIAAAAAGLLLAGAILATGSRGAMMGWVLTIVAAVIWRFRERRRAVIAAVAVAAVIGGVAGITLVHRFRTRDDPYALGRIRIWPAAARIGADHPLLGVGPGMLESRAFNYNPPEPGAMVRYSKRFRSAHSTYLQVFAETGVPGLVLALAAAAALLRLLLRRYGPDRRRFPWLGFAVVSLMLHGLVENLLGVPALALTVLILAGMEGSATAATAGEPDRRTLSFGTAPAVVAVTATVYLYWVFACAPFLADRQFGKMRRATDAAGFLHHMNAAIRYNPFQPYYFWQGADRVLRGIGALEPDSFAAVHGWLRTAIDLEPGEPRFHRDMARLYVRAFLELFRDLPTRDRALEAFDAAFACNRTDPRPLVEKARFERLAGMPEAGLQPLQAAIEVEPAYVAARLERLEILAGLGRTEQYRRERTEAERLLQGLQSYRPRNDYERSIVAVDADRWDRLPAAAGPSGDPLP